MKKTTPAIIATFLTSLVLGGSMLMIGLDATRPSAATTVTTAAAVPQGIVNIYTNPTLASQVKLNSVPASNSTTKTVLRTAGS